MAKTAAAKLLEAARRSPALEAAYIALMAEARRVLQVVKVAALTHAAEQFVSIAKNPYTLGDDAARYIGASKRCADEAVVQLGQVTG
jgi:hypothetical protein